MRQAGVYHRRGFWLVGPFAMMENGPSVTIDPFVRIPDAISYGDLAGEVRAALQRSRTIPDINLRETELPPSPVLAAAGVKSFATFHRGAKMVSIVERDGTIHVTASANRGARGGFAYLEPIVIPATATLDELGDALQQAFARCR